MTEIPESLLRRSAEAKAKALGLPVEQVLAEMKGEAPPTPPPASEPEPEEAVVEDAVEEVPPASAVPAEEPVVEVESEPVVAADAPHEAPAEDSTPPDPEPDETAVEASEESGSERARSACPGDRGDSRRLRWRPRRLRLPSPPWSRSRHRRSKETAPETGRWLPRSAPGPWCRPRGPRKGCGPNDSSPLSRPVRFRPSRPSPPTR